jgi:hypothetical protein
MLNLKIIILLMGVFLMSVGFANSKKECSNVKTKFQPFPRNVYDEIWMAQPSLLYSEQLSEKINPTYIMEDASDYKSIFQRTPYLDQVSDDKYSSINKRIENYEEAF